MNNEYTSTSDFSISWTTVNCEFNSFKDVYDFCKLNCRDMFAIDNLQHQLRFKDERDATLFSLKWK